MSGPEWTPESGGPNPAEPPLTTPETAGDPGSAPSQAVRVGRNPIGGPARPAPTDQDDAAAQSNLEADAAAAAGPSKIAMVVGSVRAAVVGLIASLWNRRRARADAPDAEAEAADADAPLDSPAPADPADDPAAAASSPARSGLRAWSPAGWSWETRVGVAAVFSFLILVGVLVVKKGWLGDWKRPTVAIRSEAGTDPKDPAARPDSVDATATTKPPGDGKLPPSSPPPPTVATTQPSSTDAKPKPGEDPHQVPEPAVAALPPLLKPEATAQANPTTLPVTGSGGTLPIDTTEVTASTATGGPPEMRESLPPGPELPPAAASTPPDAQAGPPVADEKLPAIPEAKVEPVAVAAVPPASSEAPAPAEPKEASAPTEPAATPTTEPVAAPVATAEPARPTATPAPTVAPEPAAVAESTTLRPANPPVFEPVPTPTTDGVSTASSRGENWVVVPSAGKRPSTSSASDLGASDAPGNGDGSITSRSRTRVGDGPPVRDEAGPEGFELHTVQAGESYWTISKLYYNSPRYYKALHKANAGRVPKDIKELYIGTVLRIPPPESLDRSLVTAPVLGAALDGATVSRASSAAKSGDSDTDTGVVPPLRSTRPGYRRARDKPIDATEAPQRPTYQVKANDTLRSIARDTMSDSHRANEIYNLNRDSITDPRAPIPLGTTLTLPEDAVVGRRVR